MNLLPNRHRIAALGVVLCLGLSTLNCAVQSASERKHQETHGVVVVESDTDADVVIDGGAAKAVTAGEERPFSLRPGEHRLEVRHPDYLTRRYDVDVEANEATILRVQMWPRVEEIDDAE